MHAVTAVKNIYENPIIPCVHYIQHKARRRGLFYLKHKKERAAQRLKKMTPLCAYKKFSQRSTHYKELLRAEGVFL